MVQAHHGHVHKSGGYNSMEPESGNECGHRGCRSGGPDTGILDAARGTKHAGGTPTTAAWKTAQIEAKPKVEPSTNTDTDTEAHIDANDSSADTEQTMGASPTTKPKEIGQPSPSCDIRLELGRQSPDLKES